MISVEFGDMKYKVEKLLENKLFLFNLIYVQPYVGKNIFELR